MSVQNFWIKIRNAASFLAPQSVDAPHLDNRKIESMLRGTHLWLTPFVVSGYKEEDFEFLSDDDRDKLSRCIEQFQAVASKVPGNQPVNDAQVNDALPSFRCILDVVRLDQFFDPDAFVIGKQVEQRLSGQLPPWVKELRFETGFDANGDKAIWISVEIDDSAANPEKFSTNTRLVRETIQTCVRQLNVSHWPYVRFRTTSELLPQHDEDAE